MRWGPGRSVVAFWKRMRDLRGGDCACECGDDDEELVNTLRNGQGPPDADLGIDGDFYIDTDAETMYGPKGGIGGALPGEWVFAGSPISLVGPEGPNPEVTGRKVLYGDDPDTPIGGAAHATISDDGYIEAPAIILGGEAADVAAAGTIRGKDEFNIQVKSALDAVDKLLMYYRASDGGALVGYGGGSGTRARWARHAAIGGQYAAGLYVNKADDSGNQGASVRAVGPDSASSPTATGWAEYGGFVAPNSYLNGPAPNYPSLPWGGGTGIGVIAYQTVAPTTGAVANTMMFRVTGPGVFEVLFPGEDVSTGWTNLIGQGSGDDGAAITIEETTADIPLGSGSDRVTTITLSQTGETNIDLSSVVAPEEGRSAHIRVINKAGAYGRVLHETGSTAANTIIAPNGTDYVFSSDYEGGTLTYDHETARWIFHPFLVVAAP